MTSMYIGADSKLNTTPMISSDQGIPLLDSTLTNLTFSQSQIPWKHSNASQCSDATTTGFRDAGSQAQHSALMTQTNLSSETFPKSSFVSVRFCSPYEDRLADQRQTDQPIEEATPTFHDLSVSGQSQRFCGSIEDTQHSSQNNTDKKAVSAAVDASCCGHPEGDMDWKFAVFSNGAPCQVDLPLEKTDIGSDPCTTTAQLLASQQESNSLTSYSVNTALLRSINEGDVLSDECTEQVSRTTADSPTCLLERRSNNEILKPSNAMQSDSNNLQGELTCVSMHSGSDSGCKISDQHSTVTALNNKHIPKSQSQLGSPAVCDTTETTSENEENQRLFSDCDGNYCQMHQMSEAVNSTTTDDGYEQQQDAEEEIDHEQPLNLSVTTLSKSNFYQENSRQEPSYDESSSARLLDDKVDSGASAHLGDVASGKAVLWNNDIDSDLTPKSASEQQQTASTTQIIYWNESKQCNDILLLDLTQHSTEPPPHFNAKRDEIVKTLQGKRIYLFLDYDGTLTPIVKNPWEAYLSEVNRKLLYNLASSSNNLVTVGIVTGRALSAVKNFVQITASENINFIYAASHGFHIEAAGKMLHHRVGSKFIPILKEAAGEVENAVKDIPGVLLEDNEFAVSVHFRNAPEGSEEKIEELINGILKRYPKIRMTRGKKVFELRINVVWDKGRAVFWLLNAMRVDPFDETIQVFYIGDDLTDEDAFKALRTLSNAFTILVSNQPEKRETAASYYVNDTDEVTGILNVVLEVATQDQSGTCTLT